MADLDPILSQLFDVIIVGAGPAGCVLASRLSEDPARQVLLIEAGPDLAKPGFEDPDLLSPFAPLGKSNPALRFPGMTAKLHDRWPGQTPYVQGFGVGGGSNINGMGVDRGLPDDYDEWRSFGVTGWDWKDVLPYFCRLEHDADYAGSTPNPLHGGEGPMPVRRAHRADWPGFSAAICDAAERRGYPFLADYTGDFREGFSAVPNNEEGGRRISAAVAYLTSAVRARRNFTLVSEARVDRVVCIDGRAAGVDVQIDGDVQRLAGREVILTCGALRSPSLLMHSGIGPAEHLREQGIEVVADRSGVGANLQNHPFVGLITYLRRAAFQKKNDPTFLQNWMRFSSKAPECPPNDMHLILVNKADWHALGRRVGTMVVSLFKPYSRGRVTLASPDPSDAPHVEFDLLSDPRDFERMVGAVQFGAELLLDPKVKTMHREVFMPNGRMIARLNPRSAMNAMLARLLAAILDIPVLRALALKSSRIDLEALRDDDAARRAFISKYIQVQYHVAGTCRMGAEDDQGAVVDSTGRVHGVAGLRIADASIYPTIPRGCTHAIVIMTAEKIADAVKNGWRS